jgi:nucleotide-binding universal stress UspA family protein
LEEQLVTLAIHTYEQAQILQTILESEGINVYIHNVNQIQPVISAGVRVRIRESDLPHALRIIESVKWKENSEKENQAGRVKKILIPVDFSDYSVKACEIGINYAYRVGAEVMLLHACFSAYIPTSFPFIVYEMGAKIEDEASIRFIHQKVQAEMDNLCTLINRQMESGELPRVSCDYIIREGLPEDVIALYVQEYRPTLIIMGTRGKMQKDKDLIGSVTGEVIESTKTPLLAIPEGMSYENMQKNARIAFAISFNQRDLIAFDKFVELLKGYDFNVHLFNISTSKNEWNEIRLTGFCEYLKKHYPELTIDFTVLQDGDLLEAIDVFVKEKQIDMIAISTFRRSMIMRIFNPSSARSMLFHTHTPLLVIPC